MQRAVSLEKTLMLGKAEGRKRRRQHYELSGHDFEQTLGDDKGQGSLVCCSRWGHKELDMPERLHNTQKSPLPLLEFLFLAPALRESLCLAHWSLPLGSCTTSC